MTDSTSTPSTQKILRDMDSYRRGALGLIILMAVIEGSCLIALYFLLDFGDPLHRVLIAITVLIYGTLSTLILALAFYSRLWSLQVLRGIRLIDERLTEAERV